MNSLIELITDSQVAGIAFVVLTIVLFIILFTIAAGIFLAIDSLIFAAN